MLRRTLSPLLVFALASCGGGESGTGPTEPLPVEPIVRGASTRALVVQQLDRSYRTWVPASADLDAGVDVVLVLHGFPPIDMAPVSEMNAEADTRGFVAVYPQSAYDQDWVHACKCTRNGVLGVDDRAYFNALLDDLEEAIPGGVNRAFVSGFSNGGMMTYTLGCELSDRFDGFASVSSGMWTWTMENRCRSTRAAPMLMFNGTADGQFPYDGVRIIVHNGAAMEMESVEETVAWWAARNDCAVAPVVTDLPDESPDGTTVQRWSFEACTAPVEYYRIEGGGHTWPGMPVSFGGGLGANSLDVSATQVMLDFFLGSATQ